LYEDEMKKVQKALKKADNNISLAARILGISRNTLYKKIKDFGIDCSKS
jgi:two-component system NtrC family response regulator